MDTYLRWILPAYIFSYYGAAFFRKVWQQKGLTKNKIQMASTNTPRGYIEKLSLHIGFLKTGNILAYSLFTNWYLSHALFPVPDALRWLGILLLPISFFLTVFGQHQMGTAWRIGIPTEDKTKLIQTGMYRFSRNPIYLGLYLMNTALLLTIPGPFTLFNFILGHFISQIYVRIEEEHLLQLHGQVFSDYCKKVRRWI